MSYLNLRTRKEYRPEGKIIRGLISARWNEGFRVEEFKKVIDNQTIKWLNDPKMCEFLRPETIFSNKFESYLNAKPNAAQAGLISPSSQGIMEWARRKQEAADAEQGQ